MSEEEEIVNGCIAGKASAQERLYKRYAPKMLGLSLRYTKSLQEAEDVLQDAFIKILRCIESYKAEGSLEGWIRKIVVNTALNHYRDTKRIMAQDVIDDDYNSVKEDTMVYSNFNTADLLNLIQSLPEGYRVVFNLYEIEGYNHREIGEMLEISENTSKSQLSKARMRLRMKLEALQKERIKKIET